MNLGGHRTALQDLSSKLYLCHYKTPFRPEKVTCRLLPHRSDFIAVSPCERRFRKLIFPKYHSKMKRRTKVYQLRLTPEEQSMLKEMAKKIKKPIADYIRAALAEYSNVDARQRLELINDLGAFYRKFRDELSWAGGNLNQSVKRANELAVAGLLPPSYIREVLMPAILETQKTLTEIKRDLETVTRKAVKL